MKTRITTVLVVLAAIFAQLSCVKPENQQQPPTTVVNNNFNANTTPATPGAPAPAAPAPSAPAPASAPAAPAVPAPAAAVSSVPEPVAAEMPPPEIQRYADDKVEDTAHYNQASQTIDNVYFYDRLAPFGDWVRASGHGFVWVPRDVPPGWRPYAVGHWVRTDDYGWMWVSDERWGWATYHYGRWYYDNAYGWAWVPGNQWAPAWVVWRHSPDSRYIGWAPIPPDVNVEIRAGAGGFRFDAIAADRYWQRNPHAWCFVGQDRFIEPDVSRYVASPAGNVTIIQNTTTVNNYTVVNNRIVDNSINVVDIERATRRPVPTLRVERAASLATHGTVVNNTTVNIFSPQVTIKVQEPPREVIVHVDDRRVRARQEAKIRDLQTRMAAMEQEIKAGRRQADAPAPEMVALPDRSRKSKETAQTGRMSPTPAPTPTPASALPPRTNPRRGTIATPTPASTPSPAPTPALTPRLTPRRGGIATPTPAPTPKPTLTPRSTPRRGGTVTPTPAPASTSTSTPALTPRSTPRRGGSATPTPSPTPTPASAPRRGARRGNAPVPTPTVTPTPAPASK